MTRLWCYMRQVADTKVCGTCMGRLVAALARSGSDHRHLVHEILDRLMNVIQKTRRQHELHACTWVLTSVGAWLKGEESCSLMWGRDCELPMEWLQPEALLCRAGML